MRRFANKDCGETSTAELPVRAVVERGLLPVSGSPVLFLTGSVIVWSLISALLMSGIGCGGKPVPPAPGNTGTTDGSGKSTGDPNPGKSTESTGATAKSSGAGKKGSSEIPYDAFFDDPLGELENTATAAGAVAANQTTQTPATTTDKPAEAAKPAPSGGATAWGEFISMDILQDEVKKLRNHMNAVMQGPGTYNKECKELGWDGAVVAGLAGIVLEHPEAASWKANAHFIRDIGFDLSNVAVGPGKENYEKSKTAHEKMVSVFSGSIPADIGGVMPKRPFSEIADRTGLMKRIHNGNEWLRLNINNEAKLKSEKDTILHEASIVAALGKIINMDGYVGAEEAEYQKYAQNLIAGAQEAATAANDQNYAKFTEAINKVGKSCSDCHPKYNQ